MSEHPFERVVAAANAGDADTIAALTHPAATLVPARTEVGGPQFRGRDGARAWLREFASLFTDFSVRILGREEGPEGVTTFLTEQRGRLAGSGEVSQQIAYDVELRDGLIWRLEGKRPE